MYDRGQKGSGRDEYFAGNGVNAVSKTTVISQLRLQEVIRRVRIVLNQIKREHFATHRSLIFCRMTRRGKHLNFSDVVRFSRFAGYRL